MDEDKEFDDLVRRRAYELWLTEGMPDGHHIEHWLRAEQQLVAETLEGVDDANRDQIPHGRITLGTAQRL